MAEVAQVVIPKNLRERAKRILILRGETLSGYLRDCLERLVRGSSTEKDGDDNPGLSDGEKARCLHLL